MPNYFRGCGAYFGDYSDKQRRDEFGVEANREDDKEGELDCDEPSVLEGLADHQQQRREHERDFIDRERDHKIGILLALGFGEAGSTIIAKNMAQQGDLNPMLQGKKLFAIFGFCNIRMFTDITDLLEEEVMVFVNTIAQVVHSLVDQY